MYNRPDRPLVVKCTFDRSNKRITFSSARNCSYDLLKNKVEQCFALYSTSYTIAYTDDDGEVSDITTDTELTEAIQYFQAGSDDPPISSAASILSGRSFGSRKITLRVHITVDYDGPSLSDTSSLASMDEYKGSNGSQTSFSFGPPSVDLDDDSVTVSSRDAGTGPTTTVQRSPFEDPSFRSKCRALSSNSSFNSQPSFLNDGRHPHVMQSECSRTRGAQFSDTYHLSATTRFPENPSSVFERLKLEDDVDLSPKRGAEWLREQNERTFKSMVVALPEPSEVSDGASLSLADSNSLALEDDSQMGGDLALKRDPSGKYYYSYTSSSASRNHDNSSQSHDSGYDDGLYDPSIDDTRAANGYHLAKQRPTSMHLNWLADQQIASTSNSDTAAGPSTSRTPLVHSSNSDPLPQRNTFPQSEEIPPEVLRFLPPTCPPPEQLTDCSECGVALEAIRYVCSTCGEKSHLTELSDEEKKGKGSESETDYISYPPPRHRTASLSSSNQLLYSSSTLNRLKPLPSLPCISSSPLSSSATLAVPLNGHEHHSIETGYELCSGCIESAGVNHALPMSFAPASPTAGGSPSSPEDAQMALSMWRRTAPKQKGQLRHAYTEKVWGYNGWEDVEQDDCHTVQCSTCNTVIIKNRFKCASCQNINLCRACYSQVHEIHPTHAFLAVPDRLIRSHSDPAPSPNVNEEQSMKHPGVKCAHCMLDILGARFHCAICKSVDICSSCESAGLPGNLDSADGGHNTSHIMIKIPYPLETNEVQTASRRAIHLWEGRDGPCILQGSGRSKPGSVVSSHARTVVGPSSRINHSLDPPEDVQDSHGMLCSACNTPIMGLRYQCANCPSLPTSYSLCQSCEERSYLLHDPMHVFIKLPRPVQHPIESPLSLLPKLYRAPAGPPLGFINATDPKEYLKDVLHTSALCDCCMTRIQREWFRCAYCAKDLCGDCEALDTHDDSHVFLVFKSMIDMHLFREFTDIENPNGSPPVISHPVYC